MSGKEALKLTTLLLFATLPYMSEVVVSSVIYLTVVTYKSLRKRERPIKIIT